MTLSDRELAAIRERAEAAPDDPYDVADGVPFRPSCAYDATDLERVTAFWREAREDVLRLVHEVHRQRALIRAFATVISHEADELAAERLSTPEQEEIPF